MIYLCGSTRTKMEIDNLKTENQNLKAENENLKKFLREWYEAKNKIILAHQDLEREYLYHPWDTNMSYCSQCLAKYARVTQVAFGLPIWGHFR